MILTCPSCGTQYAVKDGAIPPAGRQVRCASCKHAWHQHPEEGPQDGPQPAEEGAGAAPGPNPVVPAAAFDQEPSQEEAAAEPAGYPPIDPVAPPGEALVKDAPAQPTQDRAPVEERVLAEEQDAFVEQAPGEGQGPIEDQGAIDDQGPIEQPGRADGQWSPPPQQAVRDEEPPPAALAYEDDFSPFTLEEHDYARRRSPLLTVLMIALSIAALAAAFWFLAPPEWKERVGIAAAGETPLQLMMTHSDRQKLPSGNEMLEISGRVINPTDEQQNVPPIRAQLRNSSGKLVYSWTIAPPARTLPPGASATFNSAEVDVPSGGDELTITLGSAKS